MAKSSKGSFPLWMILIYAVLGAGCAALIVFGAVNVQQPHGLGSFLAGIVGFVIILASLPLAILLHSVASRNYSFSTSRAAESLLEKIHETNMLSDSAKRVLFRERELDLLRRTIEEDIARGDFNAGLTLCDAMANVFGHREEAETFRSRLLEAGHASYEAQVNQSIAEFDAILVQRDWARAYQEAARLKRLFPESPTVQALDAHILHAREDHKRQLEEQFLDAAHRDDVETAMSLLKELDKYLTREEAGRVASTAQSVVAKRRDILGSQFKIAVSDHRWAEAAQTGELIMAEFPNSKMADEVRSMIDVIRTRATQAAVMAGQD
jgi:hypothetical protein